jgi:hypothetical protein
MDEESKEHRVINAKIKTRVDQINNITLVGPILIAVLGIFVFLFGVVPMGKIGILWDFAFFGVVLIGVAVWWGNTRQNEIKRLQNEIRELEAELE